MRRHDVRELHYITCAANVPSILQHGILSHERADGHHHTTIANQEVQDRRAGRQVAGRPLHSYANLYFWARNAMLYLRFQVDRRSDLCVLSIDHRVLDRPDVVVTDRNAATSWHRAAYVSMDGLAIVDREHTFAVRWTHPDPLEQERRKSAGQAEVLVPDEVPPGYVRGAYLPGPRACAAFNQQVPALALRPWPHLFFIGAPADSGDLYHPPT
jgi:hypothetical protein